MNSKEPIRYPIGFNNRHQCLYAIKSIDELTPLDYIESRKQIYLPLYIDLVKRESQFLELKMRLTKGENLLIIEVDGPHQESLDYYKDKYSVNDDFIENSTILVNEENMNIMLNDEKHPFGHGYCLAMALKFFA